MSKNEISNSRRVGMLYYMTSKPRSFKELLSFTGVDASILQEILDFGIKRKVIIVSNNKYSTYPDVSEDLKKEFFRFRIEKPKCKSNFGRHNSNEDGNKVLISSKKRVMKQKHSTVRKKFKKAITVDHIKHFGGLDMADEQILQEYSRSVEFGHGKKKGWTDIVALQYQKEKEELLKNRKKIDSTDRFAVK